MKKWLFFSGSAIIAIFAFLVFSIWSSCSGNLPIVQIPSEVFPNCFPALQYIFLFLALAAAALFVAFVLTSDHEVNKKH